MTTRSTSSPKNDPLSSALNSCSLSESEWPSVRLQLRDFPHSFQMQNQKKLEEKKLKQMKQGLESALSVGYKTDLETARARNLLAYVLHRLGRSEDALRELETVVNLDKENTNLVTLANRAFILQSQRRFSEAQDQVHALVQMQKEDGFEYLVVRANAELAFSYTRMSPGFSEFAVPKFQEVIPKARDPEKWLWKFGLALTKRRSLRGQRTEFSPQVSQESLENYREVLQLLMDIIKNDTSRNLKAKAYAELALLLFMCSKNGLKAEFYFKSQLDPERACQLALRLDTNDNSVLCKCGRILRYCKQPEKAMELLEKAVSMRPSATAYHHLAITYRYMANRERYKGLVSVAGSRGQRQSPLPRPSSGQCRPNDYTRDGQTFQQRRRCDGARRYYTERPSTSSAMKVTSGFTPQKGPSAGQEVANSASVDVPSLSKDDVWVRKALYNFEKSVEISDGQNTRAILDFAMMQKNVGELEKAKEILETVMKKHEYGRYDSDRVQLCQQMGFILEELAKTDCDERKKKMLYRDSTAIFNIALKHASEILSQSSRDSERVVEVYSTLGELLRDMEASGNSQPWRLGEKAKLVQLIKENGNSLGLLQEIKSMDRQTADEPAYHKRCIDNYVALGQYEKALAFVELLKCTTLSNATLQRFEDPQYMLKIYVQAACQALREGSLLAGMHFRSAFEEAKAACLVETSISEHVNTDGDATAATKKEKAFWDLVIVCGEAARVTADALIQLLRDVCGLRVTILDKDDPADELDTEDDLQVLTNSAMVAVMAGGKISRQNRLYIRLAATRHNTVALIVDGNDPPELLREHRTHVCPPELIQSCQTARSGTLEESEAGAIAEFFSFLVKVDST